MDDRESRLLPDDGEGAARRLLFKNAGTLEELDAFVAW